MVNLLNRVRSCWFRGVVITKSSESGETVMVPGGGNHKVF